MCLKHVHHLGRLFDSFFPKLPIVRVNLNRAVPVLFVEVLLVKCLILRQLFQFLVCCIQGQLQFNISSLGVLQLLLKLGCLVLLILDEQRV